MSILKSKSQALYEKLKYHRGQLVKKYTAGGTIRYDVAIGLRAPSTFAGGVETLGALRTKTVPHFREDGTIIPGTRTVIDFDAVKAANIADGIASGTMMDALKARATGKIVRLEANDNGLSWGMIVLGEVECLLQIGGDIKGINGSTAPAFTADTAESVGTVHALRVPGGKYTPAGAALTAFPELAGLQNMKIESEIMTHRGQFKPQNYRGDAEWMKNPVSIWAITDKSRQSQNLFAHNSLIRMWGDNQVIDLNGFKISQHERPARVAAFHCLIDLSDGHFAGLSQKGARNCHIYSSSGVGILGRNNHFAIRGHFVKGCLIEGVLSGQDGTLNEGSYFGTAIFNDSSEIVMKDVHQKMVNKAVSNSSAGLSWYAQLTSIESFFARYETVSSFSTGANYPWMIWENKDAAAADTFGNGKKTPYARLKTAAELAPALTTVASAQRTAVAAKIVKALDAAQVSYWKSIKHADDVYIQGNTTHGDAFENLDAGTIVSRVGQIPRIVNLVASNPKNADGVRYPDSVGYGFRAGSASEGVGKLAGERGGTIQDIYVMDCSFEAMHLSPMEAISLGMPGKGLTKTFNGMGLRAYGYTNSLSDAMSMAGSMVLVSKDAVKAVAPGVRLEQLPFETVDTASKAVANSPTKGWTALKAHGLYKGNDISEAALATIEAINLLRKYFTAAGPVAVLSGVDNSALDLGILALRRSMLNALSAKTAAQIGLKGGYNGDIFDQAQEGEIYPFFVSEDGSVSIDKDTELLQPGVKLDRSLSVGYLGTELPQISDSIYKLKQISEDTLALVTSDAETPVTYQQCADLLGFSATGIGAPDSMSAPVQYRLVRNLDGQNHVHKGAFGVRVDEASRVLVENVQVKDYVTADAKKPAQGLGSVQAQIEFGVNYADKPESTALEIHGVVLNGVTEAQVENIVVAKSHAGGSVFGVKVDGKSADVTIEGVEVYELEASEGGRLAQPFGEQSAIGVKIAKGVRDVSLKGVRAEKLEAAHEGLAKEVEIEEPLDK